MTTANFLLSGRLSAWSDGLIKGVIMKSDIFNLAIRNRNRVRFLYGLNETVIDPYLISQEKNGKKFIYGKLCSSNEIRKFEYNRIANIKVLRNLKFSPVIPILSKAV